MSELMQAPEPSERAMGFEEGVKYERRQGDFRLANQKSAILKAVAGLRKTEEFGHRGFNSAIDKALQTIKEATP